MDNNNLWARNNLDRSSSPYLQQHAGNPIWWQEWSRETLDHALAENKPLLVSVGYSTCHWCHVMAAEAFSDKETADYLNTSFISIKVDREQRPDIDQYMMHFIQALTGSGGWPLNVFLTADLRPVHALTYAPAKSAGNRNSFLGIARAVSDYLHSNTSNIRPFSATDEEAPHADADQLTESLAEYYDQGYGGFGTGQKFPPHSSLLFMLYQLSVEQDDSLSGMVTTTLDAMMLRGLNDHLQGGIYRYCVDREWTIPHFEKMLYDQAMALWSYSLACRLTGSEHYRTMADKIVKCLDDTFLNEGMFVSAFNADTDHKEGATYLWSADEIASLLTQEEFTRFLEVYHVTGEGNFEGLNHLIRKNSDRIDSIEEKLLNARLKRSQPSRDDKILSGLNALTAVALLQAGRHLDRPELEGRAAELVWRLLETFWDGSSLGHSYYEGKLQRQSFLSDAAALLLAVTMLWETDESWGEVMGTLADYVKTFREDGKWVESRADDFRIVYASWFDHPVPSAVSMAEMALTRFALLTGGEVTPAHFRRPYQSDFYNINVLLSEDLFHLYT
ncbi:thioredoxin domain-containing protein, partial [bacterium]|nr:thioredoxin domain-containing protein [bacterium]